jgi:predicted phosphodiesterase
MPWSKSDLTKAQRILKKHRVANFNEAVQELSEALGRDITKDALQKAFQRNDLGAPSSFCRTEKSKPNHDSVPETKKGDNQTDPSISKLVEITKKKPTLFSDLCDAMGLPPAKTKALIEKAKESGIKIHVEHDHVGLKISEPDNRVQSVGIAPVIGERQKVAVISDTHLGSKYCLREQLREFILYAYSQGVREILHPGDILDGQYRHGIYEVSHVGIEEQTRDLFETLPCLPGLNYRAITGNHDFTFTEASGIEVGPFIENYFRQRGRTDFHCYGNRGAFLRVGGVVVHLWHPRSGVPYARSYGVQKQIEKYSVVKPQILLTGHWHIFNLCTERGVQGIACPTFQGGGSAFGKSIGGSPAIGGLILSWDLTEHGTMRSFILEKRAYFEVEKPVQVENDIDGIKISLT